MNCMHFIGFNNIDAELSFSVWAFFAPKRKVNGSILQTKLMQSTLLITKVKFIILMIQLCEWRLSHWDKGQSIICSKIYVWLGIPTWYQLCMQEVNISIDRKSAGYDPFCVQAARKNGLQRYVRLSLLLSYMDIKALHKTRVVSYVTCRERKKC